MRHQRGNILFLILLAVVLFAALAYAVTSSMRGGGRNASGESDKAAASAVLQYMTLVRNEVQRLMLVNDCQFNNLDFRNDVYRRVSGTLTDVHSSVAPTIPKAGCAVFASQGGSVMPQTFEKYAQSGYLEYYMANDTNYFRPGHFAFRYLTRVNEGTGEAEIAMFTIGLKNEICAYMLDPSNPPSSLVSDPHSNTSLNETPPTYTTTGQTINEPVNLYGDAFALRYSNVGTMPCLAGMVLVPR